ncbi:hypothetical protein [Haloechinothrix halophila]|uniref:hypothetical protein n=1 Tax=Haloechinothrix halophila TaxID=1069073 RepID=UPI0012FB5832|nr:hypothetical protein [Haloechinothrix halophila]
MAQRFPLVARPRPACVPLVRRVTQLCERAEQATQNGDRTAASAVHNQAALLASDCGLPDLAREWCHRQAKLHLRGYPLSGQSARHALEPLVNLARLHIRDGHGKRAFHLIDALYAAVANRAHAVIDGVEIPACLTDTAEAHQEVRRWLWAVLLATSARAFAVAGLWHDAHTRLGVYKGIGRRMLDGRQVAVIARAVTGDTGTALGLLHDTEPGEPWENAVTACLTLHCGGSDRPDLDNLLYPYHQLDASTPGLAVFHTRLALCFVDAISDIDESRTEQMTLELIDCVIARQDGYAAHELLDHNTCQSLMANARHQELTNLVEVCALGRGSLPPRELANLQSALDTTELAITSGRERRAS